MLAKRVWSFLFLAVAAFYLYGLGAVPLVGPDEPRYAQVAREMLARHDLITPTLGGLPWFEKPPLLYWMMMASYRVFGVNEFSARLAPAICGLLTAVFVYWIASRGTSPTVREGSEVAHGSRNDLDRYSALVFLSSLGVIAFARAASFDIVLTMTVTGAFACFFAWQVRYRTRSGSDGIKANPPPARITLLLPACYFFIGLSLLAKGLIGVVIPFGVIACYFLLRREWPPRKVVASLSWGAPLALAVAAVWYGPMIALHGWSFIDQFIIQHHFARFATNKYHHPAPFYFYLPVLAGLALPWTAELVAAFVSARRWNWRGDAPLDRFRVFALAWIIVPVVFFSFSGSKLTAYILPVMPAVALLSGERLECYLRAGRGDKVTRLTGALLIALALVGAWYSVRHQWCVVASLFGRRHCVAASTNAQSSLRVDSGSDVCGVGHRHQLRCAGRSADGIRARFAGRGKCSRIWRRPRGSIAQHRADSRILRGRPPGLRFRRRANQTGRSAPGRRSRSPQRRRGLVFRPDSIRVTVDVLSEDPGGSHR